MLAIVGALFAATTSAAATMYGFTNENPAVMLNVDALTPSSANTVVIGTAQFGVSGAAWNPKDGKLYAMLRCAAATVTNTSSACVNLLNTLVTIDPATAQIVDNFGQCTGELFDGNSDYYEVIGSLEIDLDGKLYGITGCSASPIDRIVFITITDQNTCTYTLGPALEPAIGDNCMNGLAVNDKNEMFLLVPDRNQPFDFYQINRTTGAVIKSLGSLSNIVAGVQLDFLNRLKFNPDVPNEAWAWWYPLSGNGGGVQGTNGFLKFTLTTDGVSNAQFFDINYPYIADGSNQIATKRVNAFAFVPPCVSCVNGVCDCKKACPQPDGTRCDDGRGTTHTDICVDNTCTSCADRKQCADPKDISLTLPDGQLICGDIVDPDSNCRAPNLKINDWSSSTLTNANNGQSVALTTDFKGCFAPTFANNTLVGFTNAQNGRSIVFSRNGQCWLKFIKPIVNAKRNALQTTTTTVTISAAHLLPAVGGATGDPHITGPRGEHFEFQGRRAARYTMISGPKYFINAQMSVEQGDVHFMTQVHVRVGDVEFTAAQLSLFDATEKDLAPLNVKLAPHSANVTVVNRRHNGIVPLPPQLVLNLCGGQERIIVTAVKPSQRQVTAFHLFETTLYYNIEFEVAGCHDELDGVIGQLYQCKYNAQPFVYDAAVVEQRFAVENFDDVPASFKPRASCLRLQAHEDIVGGVAAFN